MKTFLHLIKMVSWYVQDTDHTIILTKVSDSVKGPLFISSDSS